MYFLGLDIGNASVKEALVEQMTGRSFSVLLGQEGEMSIHAIKKDILGVRISYQMYGLVLIDGKEKPLRKNSIWCDSRAVFILLQRIN